MDIPQITSEKSAVSGDMGQGYLATGKDVAMRQWQEDACQFGKSRTRDYETVGYLLSGVFELEVDGNVAKIETGDSWLVPADVSHRYRILEPIIAIEATSPPARLNDRDEPV